MAQTVTSLICPVVIGRAPELAALARFLGGDGGPVLLVSGEAGIGKSRLIAEARNRARQLGQVVLQGSCFAPDRALPYGPMLDLLRPLVTRITAGESSRSAPVAIAELPLLLPELAVPSSVQPPALTLEPEQRKRRTFYALTDVLTGLATPAPLLLIIEDLHWCDEASLEFILHLARHWVAGAARLVLSFRSDEIFPGLSCFLADLQRERLAGEIALSRLSDDETRAMVSTVLGPEQRPPPPLVDGICRLTDGNPFFVEEVLTSLARMEATPSPLTVGSAWPRGALPIPRTIQDAIQQRVLRLSEPARRLLTFAAVAGRRFDVTLLLALTKDEEGELLRRMKELIGQQLVVEESTDQFAFRHALTREAVYLDLLGRERRSLHQTIAEELEKGTAGKPDARMVDLASHFFAAENWTKARVYAARAGEQALERYAPDAAATQFSRAITAAGKLGEPVPAQFHRDRGRAYEILGDFARADADYVAVEQIARDLGDRRAQWQALLNLAHLWSSRDYDQTGRYIERALALARLLGDSAALAHTLNRLGNWHINREEFAEALPLHHEALALFEAQADQRGIAETLDVLGMTNVIGAHVVAASAAWERAIPILRALDDRPRLIIDLICWALTSGFYWSDTVAPVSLDRAAVLQAGAEAVAIARGMEFRAGEAFALYELALWHGPRAEYARALDLAGASLAIADEIEHQEWCVGALGSLAAIEVDLLNLDRAREHAERGYRLAREIRSTIWIHLLASVLAAAYVEQGQLDRAATLLDEASSREAPVETLGQRRCWCARGELALARGKPETALEIADQLIALAADGPGARIAPRVGKLRGEALLGLRRLDEAEATLRDARTEARAGGLAPTIWRIDVALGRLYLTRGERLAARRAFATARAMIEELARQLPDAALRETFRTGALSRLPAPRPPSAQRAAKETFGGLTARERDVARRIAAGKSNRAIAEDLVVGERTVEGYVSSILDKLGFRSRAQVAGWAVAKGLTPDAE